LRYPIFQAPHFGAGPELVAAVSNAGALGILGGLNRVTSESAHEYVKATRKLTKRLFAVNYILAFDPRSLPGALEAGAPSCISHGDCDEENGFVAAHAGAKFGVQIGNAIGARAALDLGADYLVCQGVEPEDMSNPVRALRTSSRILDEFGNARLGRRGHQPWQKDKESAASRRLRRHARHAVCGHAGSLQHPDHKKALIKARGENSAFVCFQDVGRVAIIGHCARAFEQWEAARLCTGWE